MELVPTSTALLAIILYSPPATACKPPCVRIQAMDLPCTFIIMRSPAASCEPIRDARGRGLANIPELIRSSSWQRTSRTAVFALEGAALMASCVRSTPDGDYGSRTSFDAQSRRSASQPQAMQITDSADRPAFPTGICTLVTFVNRLVNTLPLIMFF